MRVGAEAREGLQAEFSRCRSENSEEMQGAEISAVRIITHYAESSQGQEREFPETGIPPEQQREQWLARSVQRGWLQTSGPAPELEAVVPVQGRLQLRADAGVFTPRVVLESGAQPQDGEEAVVGTVVETT